MKTSNAFACPHCGKQCRVSAKKQMRSAGKHFGSSRPWEPPQAVQQIPRPPVMVRQVDLPFSQAIRSGFLAALLPAGAAFLFATVWWHPLAAFIGAFAIVSCAFWFWLMLKGTWLMWRAESLLGVDLDGDGHAGEPQPAVPTTTFVEFTDRRRRLQFKVEFPVSDDVMKQIAHAMLDSAGRYNFSRRDMCAATSVSDGAFEKLQGKFLQRGWACYRTEGKPNSGVVLKAAGRAVLRKYLRGGVVGGWGDGQETPP